jgi:1-acyl-sn-glycerol-3-phosphate acyltransferase
MKPAGEIRMTNGEARMADGGARFSESALSSSFASSGFELESPSSAVTPSKRSLRPSAALPRIKEWKLRFFTAYSLRHVAKHFHAVRLSRAGAVPRPAAAAPVVVYLNHASWWDPLLSLVLMTRLFPAHHAYAPIEAAQLERYGILRDMGLFGIEPGTARGGLRFLRTAEAVLRHPGAMLWLTPQGRFADARERPVLFEDGLAHVAMRAPDAVFVPLAVEYPFWMESRPEALARFGEPLRGGELPLAQGVEACSRALSLRLERTQDALAAESVARDAARFDTLLGGSAGVGGVYDRWRAFKARWRGEAFAREHGGAPA